MMHPFPGKKRTPWQDKVGKVVAISLGCLLLLNNAAWADYKKFTPKYVDFSASFAVKGLYEENETKASTTNSREDLTFQEALGVKGLGYIYSPLFVSMSTSVSLGFEQVQSKANGETHRGNGDATQFKQEFKILPSHPYNMELFFLRATPMSSGKAGQSGSTVIYEQGVLTRYDKRPWSTSLTLINHEDKSDTDSENQSLQYQLHFFGQTTKFLGSFNHTDNSTNNGASETIRDMYTLGLSKDFGIVSFNSHWNRDMQEEDNSSFGLETYSANLEQEEFLAGIGLDLPYNFDSSLSYNTTDRESKYTRDSGDKRTATDTEKYRFTLQHSLYTSLNSGYSATHQSTNSTGGESKQDSHKLNFNYTKKIPWGLVVAGLFGTTSSLDNTGAPIALFETHSLTPGIALGSINLTYQNIDESTITVQLIDSTNNDRLIPLVPDVDYHVDPFNDSFRIVIINWPPVNEPLMPGNAQDYLYQVNYAFIPADFILRTDNIGANFQLPLFNNLLTPTYSYSQSDQKVTDGIFPGEPANSKSHTLGLGFSMSPFRGGISRGWLRSNTRSEDYFSTFGTYAKEITPFTAGDLSLSFEDTDSTQHSQGASGPPISLSEQLYTAQAQLQTIFPEKNLNFSLSSSYSFYKGEGETTNLSLFSSLIWRVGKIELDVSASYTDSESKLAGSNTTNNYTVIRFLLKRELF